MYSAFSVVVVVKYLHDISDILGYICHYFILLCNMSLFPDVFLARIRLIWTITSITHSEQASATSLLRVCVFVCVGVFVAVQHAAAYRQGAAGIVRDRLCMCVSECICVFELGNVLHCLMVCVSMCVRVFSRFVMVELVASPGVFSQ